MAEKNIPFGVYYPIPLHKQKAYIDSRYKESDFPVTNDRMLLATEAPVPRRDRP